MQFWQALVNTALLGTDKKSVDPAALPDALRGLAEKIPAADREAHFLKIAALATGYLRAGTGPRQAAPPALPVCEPETAPYCPPAATRLLRTLLDGGQPYLTLLGYWLDRCHARGWVVPPDAVVRLLDAGTEKKYHSLHEGIRRVLGKRGHWLAQLHDGWGYVIEGAADPERTWQEGKPAQRKEVFAAVRAQDPGKALGWLESAWPAESAKERKELLELLAVNLGPADEAFLQSRRQEVLALGGKAKAAHLEIKAAATDLLLSLPDGALSREVWERVQPYFGKTKKLLSLSGTPVLHLALPEGGDDFLNAATMHGQFGLDKSSPHARYSDAEYWLSELVRYVPPRRWQEHFGLDAAGTLGVFADADAFWKGRDKAALSLFAVALADATYRHRDAAWASAWLAHLPKHATRAEARAQVLALAELLPPGDLEKFVETHLDQPSAHEELLTAPRLRPWPLPMAHAILRNLAQSGQDYYRMQQHQSFIEKAILHIPAAVLSELEPYRKLPGNGNEYMQRQWTDRVETPLAHLLQLRGEIEKMG